MKFCDSIRTQASCLKPHAFYRREAPMFPANFGYVAARSVEEALQLMAKHGEDGKLLAGGHSLIPAMKLGCNRRKL